MSSDSYSQIMKNLTDIQLQDYLKNIEDFHPEAIIAAISEVRKRKGDSDFLSDLEKKIKAKISGIEINPEEVKPKVEDIQQEDVQHVFEQEQEESRVEQETYSIEDTPPLYSKLFIFIVAIFFNVFLASILLAINFARTKHKNEVYKVILASFVFTIVMYYFSFMNPNNFIFFNLAGALLLEELFWVRVYGRFFQHKKQKIWITLAILVVVSLIQASLFLDLGLIQPSE